MSVPQLISFPFFIYNIYYESAKSILATVNSVDNSDQGYLVGKPQRERYVETVRMIVSVTMDKSIVILIIELFYWVIVTS